MNKCIEENRDDSPFEEENPEINFLHKRISLYNNELYIMKVSLLNEDEYEYRSFQNLISQCQRKIDMITAFQISQALKISLKDACNICKTPPSANL